MAGWLVNLFLFLFFCLLVSLLYVCSFIFVYLVGRLVVWFVGLLGGELVVGYWLIVLLLLFFFVSLFVCWLLFSFWLVES